MKAAIMRGGKIVADEIEAPKPGAGEVLVKTLACGICGSDLHTLRHGHDLVEKSKQTGGQFAMDLDKDVVMGHEFCAEILDYGPDTIKTHPVGTRVCSMPVSFKNGTAVTVGYSNEAPGGYAEQMTLFEPMLLPVPNGLATNLAALTEPMAVGLHAVQKSNINKHEVPLVVGCGPVGLAVIVALKRQGIGPIIAADFSPRRRALAEKLGADIIINPAQTSPYESWLEVGGKSADGELLPADPMTGMPTLRQAVFFECVGVPGLIQQLMQGAPKAARIIVVGVCMETDSFQPLFGINKELNIQFVLAYSAEEFAQTLHHIAEGDIDVEPLITGTVNIAGVAVAFNDLGDPEQHAKIIVVPD